MLQKRVTFGILILCLAVLSCSLQTSQDVQGLAATLAALAATQTAQAAAVAAPGAGVPPVAPVVPVAPAAASATPCTPLVTANVNAFVRKGPGTEFGDVGNLLTGQTAEVAGKLDDGTWWYIKFPSAPGGVAWIAASTVTASCLPATVAIIAAPPTPTSSVGVVTDVSVSVDPTTIGVPGCMGPILPSNVSATVTVDGPVKLKLRFVTQQDGTLSNQTLSFAKAGSKDVSDSFTPPLTAGTYWVKIVIDGQDLSGMDNQVKYKISC
jgi:uncharacterized protein YraI